MHSQIKLKIEEMKDMVKMDEVVICPKCKGKELYSHMHWLNGETMCRKCIENEWRKRRTEDARSCK
jgi:formylmethanofuran dehydrogenase subunit E